MTEKTNVIDGNFKDSIQIELQKLSNSLGKVVEISEESLGQQVGGSVAERSKSA